MLCIIFKALNQEILDKINLEHSLEIISGIDDSEDIKNDDDDSNMRGNGHNNTKKFNTYTEAQYHDDNYALRKTEFQILYYQLFIELGPKYGMHINKTKSKIIVRDKETLRPHQQTINSLFTNPEKIVENGNFEVLGIPIGTNQYINEWMVNKIKEWKAKIQLIKKMKDYHVRFYFFRNYMSVSKMVYVLKNVKYDGDPPWISDLQDIMNEIYDQIIDFNLDSLQLEQVKLPDRLGGFALRTIKQVRAAARLSTIMGNMKNSKRRDLIP